MTREELKKNYDFAEMFVRALNGRVESVLLGVYGKPWFTGKNLQNLTSERPDIDTYIDPELIKELMPYQTKAVEYSKYFNEMIEFNFGRDSHISVSHIVPTEDRFTLESHSNLFYVYEDGTVEAFYEEFSEYFNGKKAVVRNMLDRIKEDYDEEDIHSFAFNFDKKCLTFWRENFEERHSREIVCIRILNNGKMGQTQYSTMTTHYYKWEDALKEMFDFTKDSYDIWDKNINTHYRKVLDDYYHSL